MELLPVERWDAADGGETDRAERRGAARRGRCIVLDCFASAFALRASAPLNPAIARAASEGGSLAMTPARARDGFSRARGRCTIPAAVAGRTRRRPGRRKRANGGT